MNKTRLQKTQLLRQHFHREFAGEIRLSDFNTTYPNRQRNYTYTRIELANRKGVNVK